MHGKKKQVKVETNKNYHFSNRVTSSNTSYGSSIPPVHFSCPSSRISFFNAAHGEDISQLHRPSGLSTRFFSFFCQPPSGRGATDSVRTSSVLAHQFHRYCHARSFLPFLSFRSPLLEYSSLADERFGEGNRSPPHLRPEAERETLYPEKLTSVSAD